MTDLTDTHRARGTTTRRPSGTLTPGLLLLFSRGRPVEAALPLVDGTIVIGRSTPGLPVEDGLMSRQHARVSFDGAWTIEDLGSRNGTAVDGRPLATGGETRGEHHIVRAGGTLFLLVRDITPYQEHPLVREGDRVVGARLAAAWKLIARATASATLHISGETGSGKELAARIYHDAGPRPKGPFVAVNCAAIPEGVAERLLFGTRRGAYSGATADAEGYVQAAHGGTLFLDEVGELEAPIQAKLLRVLETREVLPLGAARPVPVDLRLCSATHQDLFGLVSTKRFRADLYYRIGRPHVMLPPLRDRPDEIPELVVRALQTAAPDLEAHVSLVETCLLRPWPGNIRELLVEVGDAGRHVSHDTGGQVLGTHLSPRAGQRLEPASRPAPMVPAAASAASAASVAPLPSREVIMAALERNQGRVATAARDLGLRRNQLRRWLVSNNVDPKTYGPGD